MEESRSDATSELARRLDRLERRHRRLRLGSGVLVLAVAAFAISGFDEVAAPAEEAVTARTVVFVDSAGDPAASLSWEANGLRFSRLVRSEAEAVGESRREGREGELRVAKPVSDLPGHILLRPGPPGPMLVLVDAAGREVARLGSPAMGPARD